MAEASIPVDPFNPGQVFACIGFAEAADVLLGGAEGCFDWSSRDATRFHLRAAGQEDPFTRVLGFLSKATVSAEAPSGSVNIATWNTSWGPPPVELSPGAPYPSPDPDSPATLAAVLRADGHALRIEHWADTVRDNVKFWAGAGGKPGMALAQDALDLVRDRTIASIADPFALAAPQSSSFRLDWRRDYVPIDAGFSLNEHDHIKAIGFPLVEILGAIGLTDSRPHCVERKRVYRYGIVGTSREVTWLPLQLMRAALGAPASPFEMRRFRMFLSSPDKKSFAITRVTEESDS